jgi:hypothetical protein
MIDNTEIVGREQKFHFDNPRVSRRWMVENRIDNAKGKGIAFSEKDRFCPAGLGRLDFQENISKAA